MDAKDRLDKIRYLSQKTVYLLSNKEFYEKTEARNTAIKFETEGTIKEIRELIELRLQMAEYIEKLSKQEYIIILRLRYFGGYSWRTIAEHLHFDMRYIMQMKANAIKELDEIIDKEENSGSKSTRV